jgi:hypothetical protein
MLKQRSLQSQGNDCGNGGPDDEDEGPEDGGPGGDAL